MARRGRCRCGFVITFHRGTNGYKARCPACGSVVRLRLRSGRGRSRASDTPLLECPQEASSRPALPSPAASPIPEDSNSVPWPVPDREEVPGLSSEPGRAPETQVLTPAADACWQQVLCPQCGSLIAEGATVCPVCRKEPSWPPHDSYQGPGADS
jgi:hypothetical protein